MLENQLIYRYSKKVMMKVKKRTSMFKILFCIYFFFRIIAQNTSSGGWFSAFKGLVGNKKLTAEDLEAVLEKMKENLIRTSC